MKSAAHILSLESMPDSAAPLRQWLARQCWVECHVLLRNTYAVAAREHPLLVLDAIFKFASRQGTWPTWLFRPDKRFPSRLAEGQGYGVTLIFPTATDTAVGVSALSDLGAWLEGAKRHFRLELATPPRVLNGELALSQLLEADSALAHATSLCLDVTSPLSVKSVTGWKGAITAAWLSQTLLRRAERLFGPIPADIREAAASSMERLRLLPWYWDYEEHQHTAKSNDGTRYLNGFCGKVYLEGDMTHALPLLAMGSHCNIGPRLSTGQGAFRLSRPQPLLDDLLFDDGTWIRAWGALARRVPLSTSDLPEGMMERACLRLDAPSSPPWVYGGTADMLLGMVLHNVLGPALHRAAPEQAAIWNDALPWLPTGVLPALLALLPLANTQMRAALDGFAHMDGVPPLAAVTDMPCDPAKPPTAFPATPETMGETQALDNNESTKDSLPHAPTCGTPLRRPCYLLTPGAAVGLESETIFARYQGERVGSVPLGHTSMLVVQGAGSVSVPLLDACAQRQIPVVFCSSSGRYRNMLAPESAAWRARNDAQLRHWDALGETGRTAVGAALLSAKIRNYLAWLGTEEEGALRQAGVLALSRLAQPCPRGVLLGTEGAFARHCFSAINSRISTKRFGCMRRLPRQRRNPLNCLLDAASSLVYSRLCVLLLGEGLSPYRGFLHCQHTRYATLAADVQEVFRARTESWLVDMLAQGSLDIDHLQQEKPGAPWSLTREGWIRLLEHFERALGTRHPGAPDTWLSLMEGQVHRLRLWCTGNAPLTLYAEGGWWSPPLPASCQPTPR